MPFCRINRVDKKYINPLDRRNKKSYHYFIMFLNSNQEVGRMKSLLVVFMAVLLSVAFVGGVIAQDRTETGFDSKFAKAKTSTVEGTVLSHDVKCKCIVLKGANGNVTVQDDYAEFMQNYDRAKGLKIGAKVKVTYKTVDFINYATKIE
jgi:hypothetical protein